MGEISKICGEIFMNELIGIIASVMVLMSFIFKSENKIRTVNIFGATLFVIYGFLINSFSVWFLNLILIVVHCYNLFIRGKRKNEKK
jgi:Ca2+/Na+ antiporter